MSQAADLPWSQVGMELATKPVASRVGARAADCRCSIVQNMLNIQSCETAVCIYLECYAHRYRISAKVICTCMVACNLVDSITVQQWSRKI